jgi:ornithine cyclodeaminase/alanine dehydrogenase-like protein (mu-crystallin family)
MALILSRQDVQRLLSVRECIDVLEPAHIAFSHGRAIMPVRLTARFHDQGIMAVMPAWLDDGPQLGVKCATSFSGNAARQLPLIAATVLLLDAETGATIAVMDGAYITEVRTAAASALATRALARDDASRLVLIGAGVQARAHLAAISAVRPLTAVTVVARTIASANRFTEARAPAFPELEFRAVESADDALAAADIVCTVCTASEPVFDPACVPAGVHINGVGSHTPSTREIPGETMRDARVVVDSREANLRECGDCLIPIEEGLFDADHVSDELGEILSGDKPGRTSDAEVTVYQSCGIGIQDLAAATLVYERALEARAGVEIDL